MGAAAAVCVRVGGRRIERVGAAGEHLVEEGEAPVRQWLPPESRQANGAEYSAKGGGSTKALEEAATMALEIREVDKLTAEVFQTPLKIIRKGEKCEQDIEAIEGEPPLCPLAKKAKHDSQGLPELEAENFNPKNWKADQTENLRFEGFLQSICLTASDLTKKNFLHLNPRAQGNAKKLSVRLAQVCSGAKTH